MTAAQIGDEVNILQEKFNAPKAEVGKVVVGQDNMLHRLLLGLLAGGHVLIEGVPGLAKTLAISTLADTLTVMTETPGRPGAAIVANPDGTLAGIFTDGDLRRLAQAGSIPVESPVREHMATEPQVVGDEQLVGEVLGLFRETHVDQIPVVDAEGRVVGLVDVQDLLEVRL